MISSVRLLLAGLALPLSAVAAAQIGTPPPVGATPERVAAIENCKGRWFEAAAIIDPATKRGTRIRLCSKEGASDAEWVATLKAAADQLRTRDMPAEPKAKLLAQIDAAISKAAPAASPAAPAPLIAVTPSPPPAVTVPPLQAAPSPLPSAPPVAAAPTPGATIRCAERGKPGEENCGLVGRDTILVIRAIGGLENGARLRLLRRGDERGEIKLSAMRPGQTVRAALPDRLCLGVNSSKVEFQLVGASGSAIQKFGPFNLHC